MTDDLITVTVSKEDLEWVIASAEDQAWNDAQLQRVRKLEAAIKTAEDIS